ncbi:MAG: Xaa-Pro peptidase family protein [Pseudomonadota bacterium]
MKGLKVFEGSRVFPVDEYHRRTAALQAAMQERDQDALLLTTPADVFYVTGFLTRFWESPSRPWFVVVPASAPPVAVIPSIGADLMRRTWISDIRTWDAPNPVDDGVGLLTDTLVSIVRPQGCIGMPMGLETQVRMPLGDFMRVSEIIAPRRFVNATDTVQRVREIKSELEIRKIREICGIADTAFGKVPEFAGAGTPLDQVFRDFQIALLDAGADWISYTAGGAGQAGYRDVISPADGTPLKTGDILMLDTGAVRDGYFCDFDRNFAMGDVDLAAHRAHVALFEATETALEKLRPGMMASDLHAMLIQALTERGASPCGGRLGHGLGLTLTEWPSLTPKDQTELRDGMVLTLEPSVLVDHGTRPGTIMVHEENIVLRADGPEMLHRRTTPELPRIGS